MGKNTKTKNLAVLLLLVASGAGHLGVVSALLLPLPCATLLQGAVALSHLGWQAGGKNCVVFTIKA